jgi:hypothetical protein
MAVLERAKTVRALDRSATAIGTTEYVRNLLITDSFKQILLFGTLFYMISVYITAHGQYTGRSSTTATQTPSVYALPVAD